NSVWTPGNHLDQLFSKHGLDHRKIAEDICTKGFKEARDNNDAIPNPNDVKKTRKAAKILLPTENSDANHRFSHLMASRTFYGDRQRELKLGSIVYDIKRDQYLLCIQPICDSIRLKRPRVFVFVQMSKSGSDEG